MLTIKSEKTSLADLTIAELRDVAWYHLDTDEFVEDLNSIKFLSRLRYADREALAEFYDWGSYLKHMDEEALQMVINAKTFESPRSRWHLDNDIWRHERQFSLEFLTKNAKRLYLNHAVNQTCITPEFVEMFSRELNLNHFFDHFVGTRDVEQFRLFSTYKDGMFMRYIMQSRNMRYLTREALTELGMSVPDYYDTVISEQRIMSGQPCDDGQRSFTIWLRKFRRVTGRVNDYPTWNEMLTLMKSHPRLNGNGYVDWIYGRCLENSAEEVSHYPERLSFQAKRVEQDAYRHITGVSEEQAAADFTVEFADIIDPASVTMTPEQVTTAMSEDADVAVAATYNVSRNRYANVDPGTAYVMAEDSDASESGGEGTDEPDD